MPRWLPPVVLCSVGALLILAGLRQSARGRDTLGWTRTRGRVVASYVEEIPGPAEEGGSRFRPVVRYTYEARGRTHESQRISAATSVESTTSDRGPAREVIERHPAGADVDVWFDPRDPRDAVLERGVPRSQVVLAVVLGMALVGAGLFVLAR